MEVKPIEVEARGLVEGARMAHYGKPEDNHNRTRLLWQAYILAKYGEDSFPQLDEDDVCYMNLLQKIARDMEAPKRDNLVDIIGYTINIDLMRA